MLTPVQPKQAAEVVPGPECRPDQECDTHHHQEVARGRLFGDSKSRAMSRGSGLRTRRHCREPFWRHLEELRRNQGVATGLGLLEHRLRLLRFSHREAPQESRTNRLPWTLPDCFSWRTNRREDSWQGGAGVFAGSMLEGLLELRRPTKPGSVDRFKDPDDDTALSRPSKGWLDCSSNVTPQATALPEPWIHQPPDHC